MKRQPTAWKKLFENDMFNKGLISKIYKELLQSIQKGKQTNKQTKNKFKSEQSTWIGIFSKKSQAIKAHEKMLKITNYQGNANQNHSEVSSHTFQIGYFQKDHKKQKSVRV